MKNQTQTDNNGYRPIDTRGRKGTRVSLTDHGTVQLAVNIIPKPEVRDRCYGFATKVLGPIMSCQHVTQVPILTGAIGFHWEVSQHLNEGLSQCVMPVMARSYGASRESSEIVLSRDNFIREKIEDRVVIVQDDVLDTGKTVYAVVEELKKYNPKQIITVFLAQKMVENQLIVPDHVLFLIDPSAWIFGFGMDLREKYRHLPFVCDANIGNYSPNGTPLY